jgi:hypothetical protein
MCPGPDTAKRRQSKLRHPMVKNSKTDLNLERIDGSGEVAQQAYKYQHTYYRQQQGAGVFS